jgi:TIR domain
MEYDVFISHASEDKDAIARPLAIRLRELGIKVWLDEFELRLGDSLRRSIDRGLSQSKFGIVVLSQTFFSKEWPQRELDGLVSKESDNKKVILPIWHNITREEISQFSPILADKLAVSTRHGIDYVAQQVLNVVNDPAHSELAIKAIPTFQKSEEPTIESIKAVTPNTHVELKPRNVITVIGVIVFVIALGATIYYSSQGLVIEAPLEVIIKEGHYYCGRFYCSVYNAFPDKKIISVEVELNVRTPNGLSTIRRQLHLAPSSLGEPYRTSSYRSDLFEYEGEISLNSNKVVNAVVVKSGQP